MINHKCIVYYCAARYIVPEYSVKATKYDQIILYLYLNTARTRTFGPGSTLRAGPVPSPVIEI